MNISDIKEVARTLFLTGVRAADPAFAVKQALEAEPIECSPQGRLIIIAFGKAACMMMEQALQQVPSGQSVDAIAVTNYENARDVDGARVFASGHPLPDQNGLNAGIEVMRMLEAASCDDTVLCLISGGGSALLPTPRAGISLEDKILVSKILLSEGLDISQMNAVRQQLSVLKGGGLSAMAHPAKVRSLIISDVVGDDISAIASGPTAPPMDSFGDITKLLKQRNLWPELPRAAQILLAEPRTPTSIKSNNTIICSNLQSLQAIADAAPEWSPQIVSEPLVGDVRQAAQHIVDYAHSQPTQAPQLLIWGGETTVTLTGAGRGGRNQELAVRVAALAAGLPGRWVFLSGGTDGRDGPTDAAGGVVTAGSLARAQADHLNVIAALRDNDSYRILDAAKGLLITGATGTNVADIQLLFRVQD
ncbi:MAG: glycerate 2-kinase [Ascidiaceihabitans sp.]|jgi:glycerate 2-kinase|tara:strand:- start:914 stop:2173 length:1260 start_codon:yes stop_codon:yes gene_type:complete